LRAAPNGHIRDFSDGRLLEGDVFRPAKLTCYSVAFSEVLTISHDSAKSSGALGSEYRGIIVTAREGTNGGEKHMLTIVSPIFTGGR
jgi:hypothetical protein